jgi:hypothetical protein
MAIWLIQTFKMAI